MKTRVSLKYFVSFCSLILRALYDVDIKKRNNEFVNIIKSRLSDLKKGNLKDI